MTAGKKYVYLLLHLLQPLPYAALGEKAHHFMPVLRLDDVGAVIDSILVREERSTQRSKSPQQGEGHFLILLDSDSLDMEKAQRIVDVISAAIAVIAPEVLLDRDLKVVPIPVNLIFRDDSYYVVYKSHLLALDQVEPIWEYFDKVNLRLELFSGIMFPGHIHKEIWELLPVFMKRPSLGKAALLYLESLRAYPVALYAEECLQISLDQRPPSLRDQTSLENAFFQAFKAVEVLLGGSLPKDDNKLRRKLHDIGLNPNTKLFVNKALIDIIQEVEKERDKRAGHGTFHRKPFAFREVLESQQLARFMVTESLSRAR
ncbi:MAG TPA: hypothetical protein ENF72_03025 [Thermococcus litoralis]|uniref:Uncharacterized protein n=1 Tax=Thermococcus litoralis TaxID=2265 RepID=A0A7C0Y261_THELI|nr:hypothetical protein [Thermococcus litoralis]